VAAAASGSSSNGIRLEDAIAVPPTETRKSSKPRQRKDKCAQLPPLAPCRLTHPTRSACARASATSCCAAPSAASARALRFCSASGSGRQSVGRTVGAVSSVLLPACSYRNIKPTRHPEKAPGSKRGRPPRPEGPAAPTCSAPCCCLRSRRQASASLSRAAAACAAWSLRAVAVGFGGNLAWMTAHQRPWLLASGPGCK
jgi:hypothetical protein